MPYTHTKHKDIPVVDKHGIHLNIYPNIGDCGFVTVDTTVGHNQEFYDTTSTFYYIILHGSGTFYLDDEPVSVEQGDCITIAPNTRIYYTGSMKMVLITNPGWDAKHEVETRANIW